MLFIYLFIYLFIFICLFIIDLFTYLSIYELLEY